MSSSASRSTSSAKLRSSSRLSPEQMPEPHAGALAVRTARSMRQRAALLALAALVFAIGIPNRLIPDRMPYVMVQYGGDALWAMFITLMMVALFPRVNSLRLAIFCLLAEWLVEASQLYQAPWIESLRHFRVGIVPIGDLILGYGFLWSDIAAYAIGTAAGFLA